jgi:hypothetical protein
MKKHAAPILAAILLLLPVLYVGSYLALVVPQGIWYDRDVVRWAEIGHYRIDSEWPARCYWPLEQIDRKMRPGAWDDSP